MVCGQGMGFLWVITNVSRGCRGCRSSTSKVGSFLFRQAPHVLLLVVCKPYFPPPFVGNISAEIIPKGCLNQRRHDPCIWFFGWNRNWERHLMKHKGYRQSLCSLSLILTRILDSHSMLYSMPLRSPSCISKIKGSTGPSFFLIR